jgi:hypothetical protein
MCNKSFTIATVVRHSISKLPENYYLFPTDIIEEQIAIGKGYIAYVPVINCISWVNVIRKRIHLQEQVRLFICMV